METTLEVLKCIITSEIFAYLVDIPSYQVIIPLVMFHSYPYRWYCMIMHML